MQINSNRKPTAEDAISQLLQDSLSKTKPIYRFEYHDRSLELLRK